jgi:hypothetical protein
MGGGVSEFKSLYILRCFFFISFYSNSKAAIFNLTGGGTIKLVELVVRGSNSSTLSAAGYNFAIVAGGGVFRAEKSSFYNLSFTNGGIVSASAVVDVIYVGPGIIQTLVSNSGTGLLINSQNAGVIKFSVSNMTISNVSTPSASKGG